MGLRNIVLTGLAALTFGCAPNINKYQAKFKRPEAKTVEVKGSLGFVDLEKAKVKYIDQIWKDEQDLDLTVMPGAPKIKLYSERKDMHMGK